MQLSKRLMKVASFVTEGMVLADIGTDHGYIPIYLVQNKIIPKAIAMDINEGPIKKAGANIKEHNLEDKITTRLSDGLENLCENEADSVLIAGMGGLLTVKILEEGKKILKGVKELVLSPHSHIEDVRRHILNNGFVITYEDMVYDAGKYYTVIKAQRYIKHQSEEYTDAEYAYGKYICFLHNSTFKDYILKELDNYANLKKDLVNNDSDSACKRLEDINKKIRMIKEIMEGRECRCRRQ